MSLRAGKIEPGLKITSPFLLFRPIWDIPSRTLVTGSHLPTPKKHIFTSAYNQNGGNMDTLDGARYQPGCMFAHDLVNKVSLIIGRCDILKSQIPPDSESGKHVLLIRRAAKSMADDVTQRSCQVDAISPTVPLRDAKLLPQA
jgi:hypothetical protein